MKHHLSQEIMAEVIIEDHHKREKHFFSTVDPWTELKKDRVGIFVLKPFLRHLLYNHIDNEFPAVVKDIKELSWSTWKKVGLDFRSKTARRTPGMGSTACG